MAPLPHPTPTLRRVVVLATVLSCLIWGAGATPTSAATHGWRATMLAQVNAVRAAAGVRPVRLCDALERSAQGYADLMADENYYGHVGPDGSAPWDRMRSQGYSWRTVGENIAAGQVDVGGVMEDWIASPDHYANLVNPAFRHVGFGHAEHAGTQYGEYWVQNFGRGRGC